MKKLKEPSFRQLFLYSKKMYCGNYYLFVYGNTYILKKQCHEIFGIIYLFLQRLLSIKFEKFDTALFQSAWSHLFPEYLDEFQPVTQGPMQGSIPERKNSKKTRDTAPLKNTIVQYKNIDTLKAMSPGSRE